MSLLVPLTFVLYSTQHAVVMCCCNCDLTSRQMCNRKTRFISQKGFAAITVLPFSRVNVVWPISAAVPKLKHASERATFIKFTQDTVWLVSDKKFRMLTLLTKHWNECFELQTENLDIKPLGHCGRDFDHTDLQAQPFVVFLRQQTSIPVKK